MGYINPNSPDPDLNRRHRVERDKAKADALAQQVLFSGRSTYNGTRQALARLAASAGKPLPHSRHEPGVKPGTEGE